MKHLMKIELSTTEGALVRVLGMVERRAFAVLSCRMYEQDGDPRLLELSVESDRPVTVLMRQLERLHDVQQVQLPAVASQLAGKLAIHTAMGTH